MGCCGCSNKGSTVTAGIFGLIQSIIGLILNAYFLNIYINYPYDLDRNNLDERLFLLFATRDSQGSITILLVVALILHCVWFLSSIILLVGNASNNTCCIRQWVVWTSFVIIGDIILPVILAIATFGSFMEVANSMNQRAQSSMQRDESIENMVKYGASSVTIDLYKYYIILLLSFSKLGLITIITNICLNVFTNRRAYEISNPRGYVMGATVTIIQGQTNVPNMIQVGPSTVVSQPPIMYNNSGMTNPYYAGNIPMQPAVAFAAPNPNYPEANGAEGIFNPLSEPLLPPKYSKEC